MFTIHDSFNRTFHYLRLSVTDACNFKCLYCLPNGYSKIAMAEGRLSIKEIYNLVTGFSELGIKKVRLTGGEPTLRKDIVEIIQTVSKIPVIKTTALTTNGFLLKSLAKPFHDAGLNAINVSVDSLDRKRFHEITGQDRLNEVLDGLASAQAAGIKNIKLNTVLLKGITEQEFDAFLSFVKNTTDISIRFIELMRTQNNGDFFSKHHLSASTIQLKLFQEGWKAKERVNTDGPAIEYFHPAFSGRIGIIAPYAKDFCHTCNRLRVSSCGKLRLCLFGEGDYSLRPYLNDQRQKNKLLAEVSRLMSQKPESHFLRKGIFGNTANLAAIGG